MATSNKKPVKTVTINYTDPAPGQSTQLQIINDPGGNVGEVQFQTTGSKFGGSNAFVWNNTTGNLGIRGNLRVTGNIYSNIYGSTANLKIQGGVSNNVLITNGDGNLSWSSIQDAGGYSNANVTSYLPIYTGNLRSGNANLGNAVTANFFIGNGSQLTGLPATYTNSNVANYLPTYTGNLNGGNANLGNSATANYFVGALYGTANLATFATTANSVALGNVTGIGNIANINLTGSNSNVLYGNGVFAPATGGGNANTGNWGFRNDTMYNMAGGEINNGDPTHGATAGLVLPQNGNTGIVTSLFNTYGNIEIAVANLGNSANTNIWQFDADGNLTLPSNTFSVNYANGTQVQLGGGGTANTGNITFDGNDIGSSNDIVNIVASNYAQLESSDSYVWVENGEAAIQVDGYQWTFHDDAVLELANGANISQTTDGITGQKTFNITPSETSDFEVVTVDGNIRLQTANSDGGPTVTSTWIFDNDGVLTVPGTITKDDALQLVSGGTTYGASVNVYGDLGRVLLRTDDGTSNKDWQFNIDGTTTFPDNILKTTNGANAVAPYSTGTAGAPLTITAGDGGSAATGWNAGAGGNLTIAAGDAGSDIGNPSWGEVGGTLVLRGGNSSRPYHGSDVQIYSGNAVASPGAISLHTGTNQWTFGKDGTTTLPNSATIISPNINDLTLRVTGQYNICTLLTGGSGYGSGGSSSAISGGSGTGMIVGYGYGLSGQVTNVGVTDPGTGYQDGDVLTMTAGDGGATFVITKYNTAANAGNNNTAPTDWIFGTNGSLTLPGGLGLQSVAVTGASNRQSLSSNSNGGSLFLTSNSPTVGEVFLMGQHTKIISGTDISDGATYKIWDFDNSGNLTLPGNTFAVNYANGDPVTISGGNPFNQDLNTNDNVQFANIQINTIRQGWNNFTKTSGYQTIADGTTTDIWIADSENITSAKFMVQFESITGSPYYENFDTLTCEIVMAKKKSNGQWSAAPITVYGIVYTSENPLVTFGSRIDGTTGKVILTCTPDVSITDTSYLKIHSVEMQSATFSHWDD